jgi:hypothetical protein
LQEEDRIILREIAALKAKLADRAALNDVSCLVDCFAVILLVVGSRAAESDLPICLFCVSVDGSVTIVQEAA